MTEAQAGRLLQLFLDELLDGWIHHGDCIGADAEAHGIARECGLRVCIHPPVEDARRAWCEGDEMHMRKTYLVRNRDIVDATERLIAAPRTEVEERRSGTWATVRFARSLNRPIFIVWPNGSLGRENCR